MNTAILSCLMSLPLAFGAVDGGLDDLVQSVMVLTGASSEEELDEGLLEHYSDLYDHPVRINCGRRSRLLSCGLFSAYQVASIEDYRKRSGDILSVTELALVDGFGERYARALAPFVSFHAAAKPGESARDSLRIAVESEDRLTVKSDTYNNAFKARVTVEDRGQASISSSSFSVTVPFNGRVSGKVVAGDFHQRYGQGIVLWTGFTLSDILSPESFVRRSTGIVPAYSYSGAGTKRGLAMDIQSGRLSCSGFVSMRDYQAGFNLTATCRKGFISITGFSAGKDSFRTGIDGKIMAGKVLLFGEGGYDWLRRAGAGTFGALYEPEDWSIAMRMMLSPKDYTSRRYGEYSAALAGLYGRAGERRFSFGAEASLLPVPVEDPGRKRLKAKINWEEPFNESWSAALRLGASCSTLANPDRYEARLDVTREREEWILKSRLHYLFSDSNAILGYLEGGFRPEGAFIYLRGTLFSIPSWNSRIYCYERDVPGSFTVPAYYGNGGVLSLYGGLGSRTKKRVRWKTAARLSYLLKISTCVESSVSFRVLCSLKFR